MCEKYKKSRPELHTLYDDREIEKWKNWWTTHEYLSIDIPTNMLEQIGVRVIYGNPFDKTITIMKNGETIKENVLKPMNVCKDCNNYHRGNCREAIQKVRAGRWFFKGENEIECKECGGKYGGGSTSRPGGSGLIAHLNRQKPKRCGKEWERKFWEKAIDEWDEKERIEKVTLITKWMELNMREIVSCMKCGKRMSMMRGLRVHVREQRNCFERLEEMVIKNPVGDGIMGKRGDWIWFILICCLFCYILFLFCFNFIILWYGSGRLDSTPTFRQKV